MNLQALPYVAHDRNVTRHYLSTTEIAERLGITRGALSSLTLPKPDVTVGTVRGWSEKTIDTWNAQRPGSGNRTPRKGSPKKA